MIGECSPRSRRSPRTGGMAGPALGVPLEARLAATIERARQSYAAYRPEVATYLFQHGFRRTADALPDDEHRDRLLEDLFRLQLESIGTCAFGVSNDAWRDNAAWPDRYFPLLWLEVAPRLLPMLPPGRRLSALVTLFNLGENLVLTAPSVGGLVADALLARLHDVVADGVELVALEAMIDLGILPRDALPARSRPRARPTAIVRLSTLSMAPFEPTLIPGAVGFVGDGGFFVADTTRPLALQFAQTGSRLGESMQLVGRTTQTGRPRMPPLAIDLEGDRLSLEEDGTVRHGATVLGHIDPRGMHGAAIGPQGTIVITRRFSQRIEVFATTHT